MELRWQVSGLYRNMAWDRRPMRLMFGSQAILRKGTFLVRQVQDRVGTEFHLSAW